MVIIMMVPIVTVTSATHHHRGLIGPNEASTPASSDVDRPYLYLNPTANILYCARCTLKVRVFDLPYIPRPKLRDDID